MRTPVLLVEVFAFLLCCSTIAGAGEAEREQLVARLERLAKSEQAQTRRAAVSLLTQLDYYEYTHGGGGYAYWGEPSPADIAEDAEELEQGEDPFADKRGNFLKGYLASNDRSRQPYSISVPQAYAEDEAIPLLVELHCHGWSEWYRPFQGHPAIELDDMIVVAPHGRGSCDYMWIAEDDVLAVIEEVRRDYRIDPNRIYVTGSSMGGTGSWNLAVRFPDVFAASYPVAGNADISAWIEAWDKIEDRDTPLWDFKWFMRTNTSPVTFAENLLQMPVRVAHGERDSIVPVGHARSITQRLAQLGYDHIEYDEAAGGTHFLGTPTYERVEWLRQFRRDPWPRRVRYKTAWYRYPGAYWVEVLSFERRLEFAEITAEVAGRSRIEVTTSNVRRFKLELDDRLVDLDNRLTVAVNDAPAFEGRPPASGELVLTVPGAESLDVRREGFPPHKRKGLEGPIEDCFRERFLIVYGTGGDARRSLTARREAMRWCRQWKRRFVAMPPHKPDSEVTDDDIAGCNLVLFGGPQCNSISERVLAAASLPVRPAVGRVFAGDRAYSGEDVGVKLCYPNALAPDRMVVMFAANTWRGLWQMSHRFGNWFDWVPYDNRDWFDYAIFDAKTTSPETFIAFGFFDDRWRLDSRYGFNGVESYRNEARPRRIPKFRSMPDRDIVRLSDVMPDRIDTSKGPVMFDRSWESNRLSIGDRTFESGFGLKVMSSIEYRIDEQFKKFTTWVGVDLEGLDPGQISEERKEAESVEFSVYGDGELLARQGGMRWNTPAKRMEVDVEGVEVLKLVADKETPEGWHYGSIAWGAPRLLKGMGERSD